LVRRIAKMANEKTKDIDSPWLTAAQAAAYLQVALGTVRNWTSALFIPHVKRGGLVRYHREDLDRWLRQRQCRGRAGFADTIRPP
jgi:excisionase family DNA binding protein